MNVSRKKRKRKGENRRRRHTDSPISLDIYMHTFCSYEFQNKFIKYCRTLTQNADVKLYAGPSQDLVSIQLEMTIKRPTKTYSILSVLGKGQYGVTYSVVKDKCLQDSTVHYAKRCVKLTPYPRDVLLPLLFNHPNVIKGHHVSYLKTELCFGLIMDRMLCDMKMLYFETKFNLSQIEIVNLVEKLVVCLLKAVEYLNDGCKLYHNDIKPDNVLMNPFQVPPDIKLSDFSLTSPLPQRGTPCYCAPECHTHHSTLYNNQSLHEIAPYVTDVWSVGVLAHCAFRRPDPVDKFTKRYPRRLIRSSTVKDELEYFFEYDCDQEFVNACSLPLTHCPVSEHVFKVCTTSVTHRPTAATVLDSLLEKQLISAAKRQNLFPPFQNSCTAKHCFNLYRPSSSSSPSVHVLVQNVALLESSPSDDDDEDGGDDDDTCDHM